MYKVMRSFQRYEGKALRKYTRGSTISLKEAARMPSLVYLLNGGFIYRLEEKPEEVTKDGTKST